MTLLERLKLWRKRRYWNGWRRIEHIRTAILTDARWMAQSPIVEALTDRYQAMLSDEWYTHPFEDVGQLRKRLGLDPHATWRKEGGHTTSSAKTNSPCAGREYCNRHPFCGCGEPDGLPERDATRSDQQQGLYRKFDVRRTDGSDGPGGKHEGCEYFVLDVRHDPHAAAALAAYADAVEPTHRHLALDLRTRHDLPAPRRRPDYPTLAERVLDPEDLGYAVSGMVRDAARCELGIAPCETPSKQRTKLYAARPAPSLGDLVERSQDLRNPDPHNLHPLPEVIGVSRMFDNKRAILVALDREPTDDELRAIHEVLKGATRVQVEPRRYEPHPDAPLEYGDDRP